MRKRVTRKGVSAHAIAGTHVVILGLNATAHARKGLLGFALHRTDETESEAYWLSGFKTFYSVEPDPVPGRLYSSRKHPVQSFHWGDYTAKPGHRYVYRVVPLYGAPHNPKAGPAVSVRVRTESESKGKHAIYFNRGVAGSQAYAREFGNRAPQDVPGRAAYIWLSRGLEEAVLAFIAQARNKRYALRAAVYEFNHAPVLEAFRAAELRKADVKVVYDARGTNPRAATEKAIKAAKLNKKDVIPRSAGKSYIAHNKFIVLLKDGHPIQVWTGSTNFTESGLYGQSNVGHLVRDRTVARHYLAYWEELARDRTPKDLRVWDDARTAVPKGAPPPGVLPLFSPRGSLAALEWYAHRFDLARHVACLTAAFGVNAKLAAVLTKDKPQLRYLLLEKRGTNYDVYAKDKDVQVSIGTYLTQDTLYRWTRERLTGFGLHVRFIHDKFMLIDPLGTDPLVISGSANFSDASTKNNDENMLVVRGDTRVADVYLGEFMRVFDHFYFRYHAERIRKQQQGKLPPKQKSAAFLAETDVWTTKYFAAGSIKRKQRELFA